MTAHSEQQSVTIWANRKWPDDTSEPTPRYITSDTFKAGTRIRSLPQEAGVLDGHSVIQAFNAGGTGYMATAPVEEQMFMHGSMAIQTSERMAGFASPLDLTEMIEHFRSDLQSSGLPNTCPHCETNYSLKLLGETIALERTSLGFDPAAGAILGRIFDRGHASFQDLTEWLESPSEWLAFSRLQRARLLYDSGTEFTVSPAGRRLIDDLMKQDGSE